MAELDPKATEILEPPSPISLNEWVKPDASTKRLEAAARREALLRANQRTYTFGYRRGFALILCFCCGVESFHPGDISNAYCPFCGVFHDDLYEVSDG